MKLLKNILAFGVLIPLLASCTDMFEPALENNRSEDNMYEDPSYAQGVLGYAYSLLPYDTKSVSDVATDDAVTNDRANSYLAMATGSWTSNNDPMSKWQGCRAAIQYINTFLSKVDDIAWAEDEKVHQMYSDRLKGEAYALRALNMYFLILAHGGWTEDGELLGIPIIKEPEDVNSDYNLPRNTYQECVDWMLDDLNMAIELLPADYADISNAEIPQRYQEIGVTNAGDYNRVNGSHMRGRITARIAEAIRAQITLVAASPAFSNGTTVTWEDAANYAAVVLDRIGGISGMDEDGYKWFMNTAEIDGLGSGACPPEILWRGDRDNSAEDYALGLNQEKDNFPPSLYGNGRINPTQNLVDAFPMANGYPIGNADSEYNPNDPYANRDPRLSEYILYNGATYGTGNTQIITGVYGTNNDALNRQSTSTRTGYYMRKLLRSDCNPNPQYNTAQFHYPVRIRMTEIFLDYAEAANEAWGPTGTGSHGYSAYDVIKAIRSRAGVGVDNGDPYLEACSASKEQMRELIRNERRIELCFENKRFWDMRRWQLDLTETAKGIEIDQVGGTLTYEVIDVERRNYSDYMTYGPIPYAEVLKWSNLQQNAGW